MTIRGRLFDSMEHAKKYGRDPTETKAYFLLNCKICSYCDITCDDTTTYYHNSKTYDHIVPKCKGGSQSIYNVAIACRLCNNVKNSMPEPEFRKISESIIKPHRYKLQRIFQELRKIGLHEESKRVLHLYKLIINPPG